MNYSAKAALCSAAVLPGAGFFILKHYLIGLCFLVLSLTSLGYILHHYVNKTLQVTEKMVLGQLPPDLGLLISKIITETDPEIAWWLSAAKWLYLLSWLLSILASAYAGHRYDKKLSTISTQE